ncbi:MAG: serine/threonine-protein phosphatase, partial [Deltaproteobacteria bacterium]|nr:serine/threonine-protein phosphatase [Deltaproteobacteria bacterium]
MIDTGQTSDVGIQREVNQDSAGVMELNDCLLLVVADGMGGHAAGETAARLVVESMFDHFEEGMDGEDPREVLYFGAQDSHRRVLMYSAEHGTMGMGSTLVAAYIKGTAIYVAHVGDSRFYLFREGRIAFRTTDHTKVQTLLEIGAITPEQAKKHPEGNIITRAVGHDRQDGMGRPFEADVLAKPLELQAGDTLLLCSDGLYDLVDDREMIAIVSGTGAQPACDRLVALANERGGHDNITVVLLHAAGGTPPPAKVIEPKPAQRTVDTLEDPIEAPSPTGGRGEAPDGPARALYTGPEPEPEPPPPSDLLPRLLVAVLAIVVIAAVTFALTSDRKGRSGTDDPTTAAAANDDDSAGTEASPEPVPVAAPVDDDDS